MNEVPMSSTQAPHTVDETKRICDSLFFNKFRNFFLNARSYRKEGGLLHKKTTFNLLMFYFNRLCWHGGL